MNGRRRLLAGMAAALTCAQLRAQPAPRQARIGFLSALGEAAQREREQAFRAGLAGLGYVEGRHYLLERRYADGSPDLLRQYAEDLARLNVDVIVTTGPSTTPAAKQATSTIPIVMAFDIDPVGAGMAASLARPGGNITGLSGQVPELAGKQLQLLGEVVPRLARVAVLGIAKQPGTAQAMAAIEQAARQMKARIRFYEVPTPSDMQEALHLAAGRDKAQGLIVLPNPATTNNAALITRLAQEARLPAIYYHPDFIRANGLLIYGSNNFEPFRRAATYVDKILKGAKPGDLPIEQPTQFELAVNLGTARALGLKIPKTVLLQATRVIE